MHRERAWTKHWPVGLHSCVTTCLSNLSDLVVRPVVTKSRPRLCFIYSLSTLRFDVSCKPLPGTGDGTVSDIRRPLMIFCIARFDNWTPCALRVADTSSARCARVNVNAVSPWPTRTELESLPLPLPLSAARGSTRLPSLMSIECATAGWRSLFAESGVPSKPERLNALWEDICEPLPPAGVSASVGSMPVFIVEVAASAARRSRSARACCVAG